MVGYIDMGGAAPADDAVRSGGSGRCIVDGRLLPFSAVDKFLKIGKCMNCNIGHCCTYV